ncbi:MAG: carotenoid biosynthesis protein [Chloroflexota bacterium]|nr:carotenoid biosynthesis protein [Chloroflexota bacterium]
MRLPTILLAAHLAALLFGVAGLLIALPNPQWWAGDPMARRAFDFGITYGGATHIIFGAAAVFALAWTVIGPRKTLIFFVVSTGLSLGSELIGTTTGWPFGNYAYTDFLGYKILGHVPYTIPLSWFYVGLTCYLLATTIVAALGWRRGTLWSLVLGVWFVTAWDLVLDPAMAAPNLAVKFWEWHIECPYFGMPLQNLAGWSVTGLAYMALSRLLWRSDPPPITDRAVASFLFIVYAANLGFAMALSGGAGLWQPIVLAIIVGLLPATLVFRQAGPRRPRPERTPSRAVPAS